MKFWALRFSMIKKFRESLIHLDKFYKNVVSTCPILTRIKYCESLIYRTKDNLAESKCKIQKRKLKRLLKAAKSELLKLNNDTKYTL